MDKIVILNAVDNVATSLSALSPGAAITLHDGQSLTVLDAVPFGHKFALAAIKPGGDIVKYGEVIGCAARSIAQGEWVHIHNVDSARGRGDLVQDELEPGTLDEGASD